MKTALSRWAIPDEDLEAELRAGQKPPDLVCLGCAAKADLVRVVYPALARLRRDLRGRTPLKFQPRDDVYVFETDGRVRVDRRTYGVGDLLAGKAPVADDVRRIAPQGLILLASLTALPKEEDFYRAMRSFLEAASAANVPFTVGKGHTVQISKTPEQRFVLADFLSFGPGTLYGVANNDTISHIDPNLAHASWITVFVALNNALNDLFLNGVWRGIEVHPTYDSRDPADGPRIRDAFRRFADRFGALDLRISDRDPIGYGVKAIGATLVGTSDRELPLNANLEEGQVILATRPIGDLAPLTEFLIRQASGEDTSGVEALRRRVLREMLVPNVEAAKVISAYLPPKGSPLDAGRHVTAARDMSGPGILALEELSEDSGVDIYLHDVVFHEDALAEVPMDNVTSGTNGAILLAAAEGLHARVAADLRSAGYRPWVAGAVGRRSDAPAIEVSEGLRRFGFLRGAGAPFFQRARWVAARRLPGI